MAPLSHVSLNEDLWIEIFKSFTFKFLCQIRCVCKSWNSIISSSIFINHHFLTNSDHSTKSKILFSSSENDTYIDDSYSIYDPQDFARAQNLNFTNLFFRSKGSKYDVIDVVNGVVCLSQTIGANKFTLSNILWNPTIHVFIEIPGSSNPFEEFITKCWRVIGFGFDSRKNEFKIVRMNNATWVNKSLTFEVYSTREGSGTWRTVATDFGPCTLVTQYGCFKNGCIHWIVKSQNLYRLLVFDCEREEFKTMEIPKKFNEQDGLRTFKPLFLIIHRGMLSMVASYAELWVMEEYGVARSWKKSKSKITDFVMFEGKSVMNLVGGTSSRGLKWKRIKALKRYHQPLIGCYDLQPSMFLMDARKVNIETTNHDDEDWKMELTNHNNFGWV